MKYMVQFQQMGQDGRPIDHPGASDFETDDNGFGMIPNVGDFVQIVAMGGEGEPSFDGKVRSRLFRYHGGDKCTINVVVESAEIDWGGLIRE